MIVIDGAEGEGGGQVLRTALSLSLVTGQAFRIDNIRGGRSRPGVLRQHVTAVEAACAIGGADCPELQVGAASLSFTPGAVKAGEHRFAVGTAGSAVLVLQTILPALILAEGPSRLVVEGGTHNPAAPPFEFLAETFLPLLERMGPRVSARLVRHGFYPAGGGRIEVDVEPVRALEPLELVQRGALQEVGARALIAALPAEIANRELAEVKKRLDWPREALRVEALPEAVGPGNILMLSARFEQVTEIVSGFGQMGVLAEGVAKKAAQRMRGFLEAGAAAAGPYLADQLLLPLALARGGCFTTVKPSGHARTGASVIERFLPLSVTFEERDEGCWLVSVSG